MLKPDKLEKENVHPRDKDIEFDEGPHIYTVKGKQDYTSVTTWNHSHFAHFDSEKTIEKIISSGKTEDPKNKYYGMTRESILESWEKNRVEASTAGTKTHYNIECYYNGLEVEDDSIEYAYFKNFKRDNENLKAYRTEWCVFDEDLKLSGSIDMVFYDEETKKYCIYDWKRSKGIEYDNNYGKMAITECINHLPDTNFWHYSLQLNIYKYILEKNYGIEIDKLCLVVLHPDHPLGNYEVIKVDVLEREVKDLCEYRKNQLKKK